MIKINKNIKSLADYRVRLLPLDIYNEPDAARVVLKLRIVETLL
jgi:hypothetical protein